MRPYYKPYRVGRFEYRGANAGDFSGINELDLLLGLCRANDPYYAQLLVDKMQFMPPADQKRLRECMRHTSFLDELLALAGKHAREDWFQRNARVYLELCSLYGRIAAQHHDQLVKRFIENPAARLGAAHLADITASGPPLPVLVRSLEVLRDLRLAANRNDIATRHADFEQLRSVLDVLRTASRGQRACPMILTARAVSMPTVTSRLRPAHHLSQQGVTHDQPSPVPGCRDACIGRVHIARAGRVENRECSADPFRLRAK